MNGNGEGQKPKTLTDQIDSALRLIENDGIPAIVVNRHNVYYDDDDDDDDDDIIKDMADIIVKRPEERSTALAAASAVDKRLAEEILKGVQQISTTKAMLDDVQPEDPPPWNINLQDEGEVAKLLQSTSPSMHGKYYTRALRAEISYNTLLKTPAGGSEHAGCQTVLRSACRASHAIHKAMAKYTMSSQWKATDSGKETQHIESIREQRLRGIQNNLNKLKHRHRIETQRLIDAWMSVVSKYVVSLSESASLLKQMMAREQDASVVAESSRVAGLLIIAIREILHETTESVHATQDAEDVLRLLKTLGHAIEESTLRVEEVTKDCIGIRPDFDEARHRELEDALLKTRSDMEKTKTAVSAKQDQLQAHVSLDQEYKIKQELSSLRVRLDASVRLEAVLAKDLRDADVQKTIMALHETCQRQITWKETSRKLAAICMKTHREFKVAYGTAARAKYMEDEIAKKEIKDVQESLQARKHELRQELLGAVSRAISLYATEAARGSSSHAHDKVQCKHVTGFLLSRVMLEYAMLT